MCDLFFDRLICKIMVLTVVTTFQVFLLLKTYYPAIFRDNYYLVYNMILQLCFLSLFVSSPSMSIPQKKNLLCLSQGRQSSNVCSWMN